MAQRVEHHPLEAAFAALLANGLDGAVPETIWPLTCHAILVGRIWRRMLRQFLRGDYR